MAQGIVKSVTPNGTFEGSYGLMYKFEIEIGEHIGEYSSKSKDQTKFVIGQQAEYDFIGGKYPKIKPVYNKPFTSGNKSFNGSPILANDPHRSIVAPSLRYLTHLVAPGWNVIGGGEPEIPGISIGHNGFGAWGLTVFRTDAEDLYVYEILKFVDEIIVGDKTLVISENFNNSLNNSSKFKIKYIID